VTTLVATVLSVLVPRLPAFSIGVVIPALLCADRLPKGEREAVTENPAWYGLITGGVGLFLNWLEGQTSQDSYEWAERKVDENVHNLGDLMVAAEHVATALSALTRRRLGSSRLRRELKSDYDGIVTAVDRARNPSGSDETALERSRAKHALITMLERAYDWRCTRIKVMPSHQLV
jgi:hypothetical protein